MDFNRRTGFSIQRQDIIAIPKEIPKEATTPAACAHPGTAPPKKASAWRLRVKSGIRL